MSEESERVSGVRVLPLFPLPLVLMPHEILPLHIFEPRYRELLSDALETNRLFGVSLFEPESAFEERPPVDSIGCVAEIKEDETLPDGRSNILTVGVIRYRVEGYEDTGKSYLEAEVEFFEDEPFEDDQLESLAEEVYDLFKRAAKASHKLSGQRGEFPEIPKAPPEQLSFLVAAAFGLDNKSKYELVSTRSTEERLEKVKEHLLQAVKHVEESVKIDKVSRTNGHANKKIDYDG